MSQKNLTNYTTEFSSRITDYVESSGYTIYKLAQVTGLGRTAIHHVMSGRLVPAWDFFERLNSVFLITPQQRAELTELYFREKIGSKSYYEQKRLIEMIEKIPQYYIENVDSAVFGENKIIESGTTVSGLINVNRVLTDIIGREMRLDEPKIFSTIPFKNEAFFELLMQLFASGSKNAVFEHYIRMFKAGENASEHNMDTLENILKMSMNTCVVYKPYSYYVHEDAADDIMPIYPYCVLTSEYAAMITADFQTAVISCNDAVKKTAAEHIEHLRTVSMLMVETIDENRMFDIFAESTRLYIKSIEFQPCLSKYLTFDVVMKRFIDIPEKEQIINTLAQDFFTSEQLDVTMTQPAECFYSEQGLEHFCETGAMVNMPGHLLEPLSIDERIYILNEMKKEVGIYYKLIDDTKFRIPGFIQIILLKNQKVLISCLMEKKNFCCLLSEQSLYNAFFELINSLVERKFTQPNEKAIYNIDKCIEKLEKEKAAV